MRRGLTILLIILAFSGLKAQKADHLINCHFDNVTFSEFCSALNRQSDVLVYYKPDWFRDLKVTLNADSITVQEALKRAVGKTGYMVSVWNDNLVILPHESLITELPSYKVNTAKKDTTLKNGHKVTESEERYLTGRKSDVRQNLRIGKSGGLLTNNKASIQGRILDEETGEPILGATLYITETRSGAASDLNGFLTLTLNPGSYNASFEFLGYEKQKYLLEVQSNGYFEVRMHKTVMQMKEVVVQGDRQVSIRTKDPGLEKISIKSIKELPMMMGERDILKVSGLMPGIVSAGEGSAGLNVRGGGSDQNAFYINKIPIYNTSHLFGFFPSFNSDIIRDFTIYKGYIPANYGGRLSSVFNILSRQGNRKKFMLHGGVSPIAGNIVLEGPLKKDICSVLLSARSTYSDWILGKIKDPDIRSSSANFNDFSAALNYDVRNSQLAVFAYHSNDHFKLSDLTEYAYSNNGLSLGYGHNFSTNFRGEFSLIGSQYNFSTIDKQFASSAYEHAYKLGHYEARIDFKQKAGEKHALEYGVAAIRYELKRGTVKPYGFESIRKTTELGNEQGMETALYLSDAYSVLPWLSLTAGLRYTLYMPLGPKEVYEYIPGTSKNIHNIQDTVYYGGDKVIARYYEPDVRVSVNLTTDPQGSVKLAFNQTHQNLFMLNTTVAIAPNTQWKLADYHIQPSESKQYSVGVFRNLPGSGLEASAEVYYKQTSNFPEFRDGADFLNDPLVETSVLQGEQQAWGVELFLKRSLNKLDGWISYTYSRSFVKVDGNELWSKINDGLAYPASHDIPHALNVVLNYHFSRRITLSSVVVYQSGKPVTYPVSIYYVNGLPVLDYSSRNAYRIPDYFRTDLALTIEGNLKKNKLLHNSMVFSLYNATGRENAYSVYFTSEDGKIKSYRYSVIGVPIFTVTWQFKLGNYASE